MNLNNNQQFSVPMNTNRSNFNDQSLIGRLRRNISENTSAPLPHNLTNADN